MLYYEGLTCPVCKAPFAADDDMVVCPQCGLPHHRACWSRENRCAMESAHGTEWQWSRAVQDNDDANGQSQPAQADGCYTAPVQAYTPAYVPNPVVENYPQEQYIDDTALSDLTAVVGHNTRYYIPRFLRASEGQSCGWNWAAFLLGQWWLIYRKQYGFGIFLFTVQTVLDLFVVFMCRGLSPDATTAEMMELLLQHPMLVPWTIAYYAYLFSHVFLGLRGNRLYLHSCQNKIRRLRKKTPDLSAAELVSSGGTAMGIVAIFYMLSYLLSLASSYISF